MSTSVGMMAFACAAVLTLHWCQPLYRAAASRHGLGAAGHNVAHFSSHCLCGETVGCIVCCSVVCLSSLPALCKQVCWLGCFRVFLTHSSCGLIDGCTQFCL
jgi:hypothetical protein